MYGKHWQIKGMYCTFATHQSSFRNSHLFYIFKVFESWKDKISGNFFEKEKIHMTFMSTIYVWVKIIECLTEKENKGIWFCFIQVLREARLISSRQESLTFEWFDRLIILRHLDGFYPRLRLAKMRFQIIASF